MTLKRTLIKAGIAVGAFITVLNSVFVVDQKATKPGIKQAVEQVFKVKVKKVTTYVHPSGQKRAYITFSAETPAIDIATQMGPM